eukprot:CAMPEP_0168541516 /NCGR_PEP_ID=MMETSP0413-20121227/860_1 /TAXON_ID=136452 /ORGANISM="Filamoeba nolandi, Strain NC-AS-23-1" /LENGTH=94 /DNA_ID=CAMNT_0008571339 /DNA_START=42 /DNA_END=326 /DNA_ORIENTATION=-
MSSSNIKVYYSSATSDLGVKKNQAALKNLLDSRKYKYTEVDMAQMEKDHRDPIYNAAGTRALPLVFQNDNFVGTYETLADINEDGKLHTVLIPN